MEISCKTSTVFVLCWKRRSFIIYVLAVCLTFNLFYHYFQSTNADFPITGENTVNNVISLYGYHKNSSKTLFTVNTPTCKIPDFDPWDDVTHLQSLRCSPKDLTSANCETKVDRKWMYVDGSVLTVNLTALKMSGHNWHSVHCCFRVIQRASNLGKYNDETVIYSKTCHHITQVRTEMKGEFIRAICFSTSNPFQFMDVLYREYFAFAIPSPQASEKITKWKEIAGSNGSDMIPPNIVILGVDSNSRLNSQRWLPKTIELLRRQGAVEMFGYTKVGENTFPNTVAFLTGLHTWEMEPFYCKRRESTHDDCPYIWKTFSKAGYLTAMAEDVPYSTCFNLNSYGFEKTPVDFYYRPFTFAISKRGPRERGGIIKCIGGFQSEQILLKYAAEIQRISGPAPTFLFTWLQAFSHECSQSVRFIDHSLENFFQDLIDNSNSIIFFMSDHGERYGPFRETTIGWYEDRLPTMWIYLPLQISKRFPEWVKALEVNSRRLSSPFDLYRTFIRILETFNTNKTLNLNDVTPKHFKRGHSFFSEIPENRTCDDAGIQSTFCACAEPKELALSNTEGQNTVESAVQKALLYLNTNVPPECLELKLEKIISVKIVETSKDSEIYIISVITTPGDFQFEISVESISVDNRNPIKTFAVNGFSDILRLDKMKGNFNCIKDTVLQMYCYCK